mmetsp:Transcript_12759/g.19114  ORF Transcript_12759/g.19114 Transcript_12759/m.19114 type:complete len:428 (+) Transcript_12759:463-1746(+)
MNVNSFVGHRFRVHFCGMKSEEKFSHTFEVRGGKGPQIHPFGGGNPEDLLPPKLFLDSLSSTANLRQFLVRSRYEAVMGMAIVLLFISNFYEKRKAPSKRSFLDVFRDLFFLPKFDKIFNSSGDVSTHDILKATAVITMLMDHTAKVFGPFEKAVNWTIPAQIGNVQLFYFLVGANINTSNFATGVKRIIVAFILLEHAIRLKYVSFETLFTIALIRTAIGTAFSSSDEKSKSKSTNSQSHSTKKLAKVQLSCPFWAKSSAGVSLHLVGFAIMILVHLVFGPFGFRALAYGASSVCFGIAGAMVSVSNTHKENENTTERLYTQRVAALWLLGGALLQGFMFFNLTVKRLDMSKTSTKVSLTVSAILVFLQLVFMVTYRFVKLEIPNFLAIAIRLLSKGSMSIYIYHLLLFLIIKKSKIGGWFSFPEK